MNKFLHKYNMQIKNPVMICKNLKNLMKNLKKKKFKKLEKNLKIYCNLNKNRLIIKQHIINLNQKLFNL